MQKVITRFDIDKDRYYKVINVVNEQAVHINIYKVVGDSFKEILPNEVGNNVGALLLQPKGGKPVNSTESRYLIEKLDKVREQSRQKVSKALDNSYETKTKVKLLASFIGITYCVVEFDGKPFYEVFQVVLDENGEVTGFSLINPANMELIIADCATKLPLYGKAKFIQVDEDNIYGMREDGNTVVMAHMMITDTEMFCKKAYGIKKVGKTFKFYSHNEVTEELTKKIESIGAVIMDTLIERVSMEMMKALDEYED